MKAKVKETEKVLKVEGVYLEDGYDYALDEIEIIPESNQTEFPIDWEQRKFELVKAIASGIFANCDYSRFDKEAMVDYTIEFADAILEEYKKIK